MLRRYGRLLWELLRGRGERVRRGGRDPLRNASRAHLVGHNGRRRCIRRAVGLEVRIRRRLAGGLLRHAGLLKARKRGLLRRFGARSRKHAWRRARRLTHVVVPWSRSLGRNDGICLIHGIRERRRRIAHGAVGHDHLLRVRKLRIELGRIAHEGRGIHHGAGDCGRVVYVREAVAIVVWDSGLVDPGAHVDRKARVAAAKVAPIR